MEEPEDPFKSFYAAGRPDFTQDARFEPLVALFAAATTTADFNDQTAWRLTDFQMKAAELSNKANEETAGWKTMKPGSFLSWRKAVEACLEHAAVAAPDAAVNAAEGEDQLEVEEEGEAAPVDDADVRVAEAMQLVERLLEGDGGTIDDEVLKGISGNDYDRLERALAEHADMLEAGVRQSFESMTADTELTVGDLIVAAKVSYSTLEYCDGCSSLSPNLT